MNSIGDLVSQTKNKTKKKKIVTLINTTHNYRLLHASFYDVYEIYMKKYVQVPYRPFKLS